MARTSNRRQQELARQKAEAASAARARKSKRRRQLMAGAVVVLVVLSTVGAFIGSRKTSTSSPTTSTAPTNTTLPKNGVNPTAAEPGATLAGPTACPAADGSSPRTTTFAEAPPMCIDTGYFYSAAITTSLGPMTVQLNPQQSPNSVNAFVVLAGYHFYDGQPITDVATRASFTIGTSFVPGVFTAPGFAIPAEQPKGGTVFTPGSLAIRPTEATGIGAQLVVSSYELAAGNDQNVNPLGVMLSGDDTLAKINALATQSGAPSKAVTIQTIVITRTSPIPN